MGFLSEGFLLFGAVLLLLYYRFPRGQKQILLAGSLVFYCGNDLWHLPLLLLTAVTAWYTGLRLQKNGKKGIFLAFLLLNFGILLACKVLLLRPGHALPLGISFYTFQAAGYCTGVYRKSHAPVQKFSDCFLYLAFFPLLVQGPIHKPGELLPQLTRSHAFQRENLALGFGRMLLGAFKKLVLAGRLAPAVAALRAEGNVYLLITLYALEIYGDFTGGIDIALGFSECLGIRLKENFRLPFFSKSIAGFWRRWHISLGEWMREYIFYPVSVSRPLRRLGKWSRKHLGAFGKRLPVYLASLITWAVTGIWHGLTPNFLIWGMCNFLVITLSQELEPIYEKFHRKFRWKQKPLYGAWEMIRTFCLMNLIRGWDLFPNPGEYIARLRLFAPLQTCLRPADWGILGVTGVFLLLWSLGEAKYGCLRTWLLEKPWLLRWSIYGFVLLMTLVFGKYGPGYDAGSFIYNQF